MSESLTPEQGKVPAKSSKPKWRTNKQTQKIERVYF